MAGGRAVWSGMASGGTLATHRGIEPARWGGGDRQRTISAGWLASVPGRPCAVDADCLPEEMCEAGVCSPRV